MSNREFKLKLWQTDSRCYWCRRETKLLNISEIQGRADPLMATLDHLISRYFPERWVRRDKTKVLSCYECNAKRAMEETSSLSREELVKRGQGYSLNPRGDPIFMEACDSLDEVFAKLKENGVTPFQNGTELKTTNGPLCTIGDSFSQQCEHVN